jgi:L-asparaginase II
MLQSSVLAEITRGEIVESRHWGAVAVVTPQGEIVAQVGDIEFVSYLRSSAKPFQAMQVILSGAAAHFGFTTRELALMSGSHSGEPDHVECAAAILAKIGLTTKDLNCGLHPPFNRKIAATLGATGYNELHNNCSGKHAGMLATALVQNYSLADYWKIQHPVQQAIGQLIADLAGLQFADMPAAIDGCSAATFAMSIKKMALTYARLVNPTSLPAVVAAAAQQVATAMIEFPTMVAAETNRIDTDLMRALPGKLVAKAGAEGVYTMGLRPCSQYPDGLGIALKIDDGDIGRARDAATLSTLRELDILTASQFEQLCEHYLRPIQNHQGLKVGEIRPTVQLVRG